MRYTAMCTVLTFLDTSDMPYSAETVHQFWNDTTGERYEIGPDRDGLGLVEIRSIDSIGKTVQAVTMPVAVATWISKILSKEYGED